MKIDDDFKGWFIHWAEIFMAMLLMAFGFGIGWHMGTIDRDEKEIARIIKLESQVEILRTQANQFYYGEND